MSDTFTEKEMNSLAKYVQKKERRIFALNAAIGQMGGPNTVYGFELNEILMMTYEDELPGSLKLQDSMPRLYPKIVRGPEKKEEKSEKSDE
jgi:hypothetical protein